MQYHAVNNQTICKSVQLYLKIKIISSLKKYFSLIFPNIKQSVCYFEDLGNNMHDACSYLKQHLPSHLDK